MFSKVKKAVKGTGAIAKAREAVISYYKNPGKHIDLSNMRDYGDGEYIVKVKTFEKVSGMKKLGSGCYSEVFEIDENRVLKIVNTTDSGYARFVALCKKNRHNPHLPKILYSGQWGGKQIYILERLTEDPYCDDNSYFRQAIREAHNPFMTHATPEIAEIARILKDNNMTNDIHNGNVMFRNGVPVVTDPVCE